MNDTSQPFTPTHHAQAENCDVAIVEPRQSMAGRSRWLLCRNRAGDEWYIPESELTEINVLKCDGCGNEIAPDGVLFGVVTGKEETQLCEKCWKFVNE